MVMMKQPVTRQRGRRGETAAIQFFEDLGWGPIETGDHDLGTDLFVQVRDEELNELLLMLGVQVKTGDSEFDEPSTVDGQAGWWFRESGSGHENYWSNHPIPHLILLQDDARERRFWAHADRDSITSTGKGFKIFVPASQPLDPRFASEWTTTAEKAQRRIALEGAHWSFDVTALPRNDRARHALLTPRLVAPHPNRGAPKSLHWAEALALVVNAALHRWEEAATRLEDVPSPENALEHGEPGWRLAAATSLWIHGDGVDSLTALDMDEAEPAIQVAHAVVTAIALDADGRTDEAISYLDRRRNEAEYSANQGWISVVRAMLAYELSDDDAARADAEQAIVQLATVPAEPTSSALRAAATWLLFQMTDTRSRSIEDAVARMDTYALWWRTGVVADGLRNGIARMFLNWADDGTITFGGEEQSHNALWTASLIAHLSGNRAQWASTQALLAKVDVLSGREGGDAVARLMESGDEKSLRRLVSRRMTTGPIKSLQDVVDDVDLERIGRTSRTAGLELIARAGDIASPAHAARHMEYLTSTLRAALGTSTHQHQQPVLRAMLGVQAAADEQAATAIAESLLSKEAEEVEARDYAGLFDVLRRRDLLESHLAALTDLANTADAPRWKRLIAAKQTPHTGVRQFVRENLLAGRTDALTAVGDLTLLDHEEVLALHRWSAGAVQQVQKEARAGVSMGRIVDPLRLGLQLLHLHPDNLDWTPFIDYVTDQDVSARSKRSGLDLLALIAERLPESVSDQLRAAARILLNSGTGRSDPDPGANPSASAFGLVLAIGGSRDEEAEAIANIASGATKDDIIQLVLHNERRQQWDALVPFVSSVIPRAQLIAVRGLVKATQVGSRSFSPLVERLIHEGGRPAAFGALQGIDAAANPEPIRSLIAALETHESAEVRGCCSDLAST